MKCDACSGSGSNWPAPNQPEPCWKCGGSGNTANSPTSPRVAAARAVTLDLRQMECGVTLGDLLSDEEIARVLVAADAVPENLSELRDGDIKITKASDLAFFARALEEDGHRHPAALMRMAAHGLAAARRTAFEEAIAMVCPCCRDGDEPKRQALGLWWHAASAGDPAEPCKAGPIRNELHALAAREESK